MINQGVAAPNCTVIYAHARLTTYNPRKLLRNALTRLETLSEPLETLTMYSEALVVTISIEPFVTLLESGRVLFWNPGEDFIKVLWNYMNRN